MRLTTDECRARLRAADHGILCTTNATGAIDAVPTCLADVGARIATPVDTVKPKSTTELGRMANLERDPAATLLCEHWDPDNWSRLWWVRARLVRALVDDVAAYEAALRAKYAHYESATFAAVLVFDVVHVVGWSGGD